jgi:hypothetical protein
MSYVKVPKVEPALLLYIITYPQAAKVIHRGAGVIHRRKKADPRVLSLTAYTYILPYKKYTLK